MKTILIIITLLFSFNAMAQDAVEIITDGKILSEKDDSNSLVYYTIHNKILYKCIVWKKKYEVGCLKLKDEGIMN